MANDSAAKQYSRLAACYDDRWSFYNQASLRETRRRLALKPGEHLLDVGCGTGLLLATLAESIPGARLSGVEPSSGMLAVARERLGGSAKLAQGPAEALPFPDGHFDVVVSTSAFHYFRQPRTAVREMSRVLRPGGRLVISDWCLDYLTVRLLDGWLRLTDPAHFRSYGSRQLAAFLEAAGMEGVRVERYRISLFWGLMTASGRKVDGGQLSD